MGRLLLLGFLAGIDNVQVAAAISVAPLRRTRRIMLAASFAVCEIASPLIGVLLAHVLRTRFNIVADGIGPFAVVACGVAIVWLALRDNDDDAQRVLESRWTLIGLPLSLSFDNLLIGVSAVSLGYPPALSALVIGGTSATMCVLGVAAGERIARFIPARTELVSGCVLIAIAASMWIRSN